jgi:hypothetical protein
LTGGIKSLLERSLSSVSFWTSFASCSCSRRTCSASFLSSFFASSAAFSASSRLLLGGQLQLHLIEPFLRQFLVLARSSSSFFSRRIQLVIGLPELLIALRRFLLLGASCKF